MSDTEIWVCPQCKTAVDISEQGFMADIMCPSCGMTSTVHTVLHNFRLERILGVGGMSIVLQAKDLVLNRPLAVKLLKDNYRNNPERVARFEKECELMAKVRHPNVVSVYSAGAANGQFYIAMELVKGTNLEMMVSPLEPMEPLKALSIVRQVAKGLNAANKAGLLHRDIKPGNVLVTRTGRAKVLDFGLSLGKSDADTEETIWATPFYVPPETLLREPEDVRTDIYALGMTLRFLLSGRETFSNEPKTPEELLECKRKLPPIRSNDYRIDESYADLINHMTAYDINVRSSGYVDLLQEMDEVHEAQSAYEKSLHPAGRIKVNIIRILSDLCVFSLGLLVAWLTCLLCTPSPVYDAVTFSQQTDGALPDEHMLNEAETDLSQNNLHDSAAKFLILAQKAQDPTMGAWGSMIVLYLADMGIAEENEETALLCLEKHLQNDTYIAPAGADTMACLRAILLASKKKDVSLPSNAQANKCIFNALLHVARMKFFAQENNNIEIKIHQEKILELLELEKSPYAQLASALKKWEDVESLKKQLISNKENKQSTVEKKKTETLVGDTQTPTLKDAPISSSAETSPLFVQRRKEAVAEMQEVSNAVDDMLHRKHRSLFNLGMSSEQKMELVSKINNTQLTREVRTLYSLMEGNVEAAIENNPYKYEPDSPEPFAALVRHWSLSSHQGGNAPLPYEKVVIATPKGLSPAYYHQKENQLSGGANGKILVHSKYGMTLESNKKDGSSQLHDYLRISNDTYCEMPPKNEAGIWIDVADVGWRGPCYLRKKTFVHPLSAMKADTATIVQRDENSISIRWNNDKDTVRYVRTAKGLYLREGAPNHIMYPLVDEKGASLALVMNMGGAKRLRESIYQTYLLKHLEVTSDAITLTRAGSNTKERYERADDGVYYFKSPASSSSGTAQQTELTYIPWLFLETGHSRDVRINREKNELIARNLGNERIATILNSNADEIQVLWKDSRVKESFKKMLCGGFVTQSFPEGTKMYSLVDYRWRGTLASIPGQESLILSARQYLKDVKVLEENETRLRLKFSEGYTASYLNDGSGVYVREPAEDGSARVCVFECPGKWRGYVGMQDNSAVHFFSPGLGAFADIVNKTDDSYTLYWKTYKTTETFKKSSWENLYILQSATEQIASQKIRFADAFTQVAAVLSADKKKLQISPKYGEFKADVIHFDENKMVLQWEDAFYARNRGLTLNDGSRFDIREKKRMNVTYTKRPDKCYTIDSVKFEDGAECEVVTVHDLRLGPVTIHKATNKAWRMTPQGQCESADVLKFEEDELVLRWHNRKAWLTLHGEETGRYIRDNQGVYRFDRVHDDDDESTNIHWGNESMFLYVSSKDKMAKAQGGALGPSKTGAVLEKTATSLRIQWINNDTGDYVETFEKDSRGEYHKK